MADTRIMTITATSLTVSARAGTSGTTLHHKNLPVYADADTGRFSMFAVNAGVPLKYVPGDVPDPLGLLPANQAPLGSSQLIHVSAGIYQPIYHCNQHQSESCTFDKADPER